MKVLLTIGILISTFNIGFATNLSQSEKITPTQAADFFYEKFGDKNNPHKKVNHTKGFCVTGDFEPRKDIKDFVKVPLLYKNSKVLARYSIGGGNAKASDKSPIHGLALQFNNDKDYWVLVMLNSVINAGKTPDIIVKYLSLVGNPNKTKELEKLASDEPSVAQFIQYGKTLGVLASLANTEFNSQHTYGVTNADGKVLKARIVFVPQAGILEMSQKESKKVNDNFLEKRLENDLKKNTVNYYMYLILANPKDITNDISAIWENTNKKVFLGTLRLKDYKGASCNSDVFLPAILPEGIEAPNDPVFDFRTQAYSITHERRQ